MAELLNLNVARDPGAVQVRQNTQASSAGIAPQYQVVLDVSGDEGIVKGQQVFPIVAALPERYNISLSSQWDAPFANKSIGENLGGGALGTFADAAAGTLGIGTRNKYQMARVWQESSPLSFNLDLVFTAKTNTKTDVMYKHIALLKLVSPSELQAGILMAPGPNIVSQVVGGRNITLQLGTYMRLEHLIVKSVSSDVQTLCGADGIPHAMTINMEVETFFAVITTDDIDKMFIA